VTPLSVVVRVLLLAVTHWTSVSVFASNSK
jgi:hypothetical protein